jgi:hypothetical protein
MTGFTDMVTVEKAYQRMSVEGCEFIAKGANGAVYRYDNETILKTYFAKDALPEIKQERENARRAFVLGINTAIPYGIVRVGDGYGTVTEGHGIGDRAPVGHAVQAGKFRSRGNQRADGFQHDLSGLGSISYFGIVQLGFTAADELNGFGFHLFFLLNQGMFAIF